MKIKGVPSRTQDLILKILWKLSNPYEMARNIKNRVLDSAILFLQARKPLSGGDIINEREVCFIGLRRTGNHAFINWLMPHIKGRRVFLNDIPLRYHPFRHHYREAKRFGFDGAKKMVESDVRGRLTHKDLLLYSYEDYSLEEVLSARLRQRRRVVFGPSKNYYEVLILRDPYNLIASRMQAGFITTKTKRKNFVDLWLEYAREFVGETHYLGDNKICVNYNRWCADQDYRIALSQQFGLPFTDSGFKKVATQGGGSSFDALDVDAESLLKKTSTRWQRFKDVPEYREAIATPGLREYSERIFGHLPGTELFEQGSSIPLSR